jgi:hypothetical protein
MTSKEFKTVGRLLKELYKDLEAKAISRGIDIFGEGYGELQTMLRETLLKRMGYTAEEYLEAKNRTINEQNTKRKAEMDVIYQNMVELEDLASDKLTEEQVEEIAKRVVPPPTTINQIVERTVVEKPTIIEKTETFVEREEYNDSELKQALAGIVDRLKAIPEPQPSISEEQIRNIFGEMFEHNINTLEMPDFRKLAMGLQQQIDQANSGVSNTITVSSDYSVKPNDNTVVITEEATISLPAGVRGKTFNVKNLSDGTVTVVAPTDIDNEVRQYVYPLDNMRVQFTGTQYIII